MRTASAFPLLLFFFCFSVSFSISGCAETVKISPDEFISKCTESPHATSYNTTCNCFYNCDDDPCFCDHDNKCYIKEFLECVNVCECTYYCDSKDHMYVYNFTTSYAKTPKYNFQDDVIYMMVTRLRCWGQHQYLTFREYQWAPLYNNMVEYIGKGAELIREAFGSIVSKCMRGSGESNPMYDTSDQYKEVSAFV